MPDETASIPVLDMGPFGLDPASPAASAFVEELRGAVHEVGFFYLVGHDVDPGRFDRVHDVARGLFARPETELLTIENTQSPQFRGYTRFGQERTNGLVDLRDQVDIGRELPAPVLAADDPAWLVLRGPNLWPDEPRDFRCVVEAWMADLEAVAHKLLRALALALGQRADAFDETVDPAELLLKVIRYRSGSDVGAAGDQGVGAHRDTGFLTFVHQDDVGGLQVERGGRFVDVPARPSALVVNIGEMFQLISRGYFKATVHRVVAPPPGVERVSVAYFFNPKLEATLAPIDLPPALAAEAPGGESVDAANPILANYGDNLLKVRLRAHPNVAERHHAALLASRRWASGGSSAAAAHAIDSSAAIASKSSRAAG
jgi:isopenicillin N synthase-like dioxygenase